KGSLLVFFCALLTVAILARGVRVGADNWKIVVAAPPSGAHTTLVTEYDPPPAAQTVWRTPLGTGATGPLGPVDFVRAVSQSEIIRWGAPPPSPAHASFGHSTFAGGWPDHGKAHWGETVPG